MESVLIVGASGYLGRHMILAFSASGWKVRVLVRSDRKIQDLKDKIDHIELVDFEDAISFSGPMAEVDLVVSSLGITRQKDGLTYMDVDYGYNYKLLMAALEAGIPGFMYISAIDAHKHRDVRMLDAKERFVDALLASTIKAYVIRPSGFFNDLTEIYRMAEKGRVIIFGHGSHRANPIHGKDVADYCVHKALQQPGVYSVGGPDVMTQREMALLAFKALGKKPKISGIPIGLALGLKALLTKVTKVSFYGPIEFFITVMTIDLIAPAYGKESLENYYKELALKAGH